MALERQAGEVLPATGRSPDALLAQTAEGLDGQSVALSKYAGKVLLVTNVASACGYTEQNYQGLQRLYDRFRDRGFEVRQSPSEQGCDQIAATRGVQGW